MANYSLIENVNQTISDFDDIQSAINEKSGAGTVLNTDPTSTYADKIRAITTANEVRTTTHILHYEDIKNGISSEKLEELRTYSSEPWVFVNNGISATMSFIEIADEALMFSCTVTGNPDVIETLMYTIDFNDNTVGSYGRNFNYIEPSTVLPNMDGTASIGTSDKYARANHVHPTDSKITTLQGYFTNGKVKNVNIATSTPKIGQTLLAMGSNNTVTTSLSLKDNGNNGGTLVCENGAFDVTSTTTFPLILKINNGTNEGTDKFTFDGSEEKTININTGGNISLNDIRNVWNKNKLSLDLHSQFEIMSRTGPYVFTMNHNDKSNDIAAIAAYDPSKVDGDVWSGIDANGYIGCFNVDDWTVVMSPDGTITSKAHIESQNGFYELSDERLKCFHDDIKVNFDQLLQLPTKYFSWKKDYENKNAPLMIGTSAQEVQKIYPELVSEKENGELSVDYAKLSVICLAAIKELKKELDEIRCNQ